MRVIRNYVAIAALAFVLGLGIVAMHPDQVTAGDVGSDLGLTSLFDTEDDIETLDGDESDEPGEPLGMPGRWKGEYWCWWECIYVCAFGHCGYVWYERCVSMGGDFSLNDVILWAF